MGEFLIFAVTPPKLATGPEQTRQIAEVTLARLRSVGIDGLVLYDIDDESDRNPNERPFPFLPRTASVYGSATRIRPERCRSSSGPHPARRRLQPRSRGHTSSGAKSDRTC